MAKLLPVEEFDLIIFGGTGDLAMRKLLPAMYHRHRDGQVTGDSRIIAVGRKSLTRSGYLQAVRQALVTHLADGDVEQAEWRRFSRRISYVEADAEAHDRWQALSTALDLTPARTRVVYLATAPNLFGTIAKGLKSNGLVTPASRIVLEKPGSVMISNPLPKSTTRSAGVLPKTRFTASIIISARRRCKTCWHCALQIHCSSRSGIAATSIMCRSRSPKIWVLPAGWSFTTGSARCGTWCKTTFCSSSA
jgi:hypothetical protein